MKIVILNIMKQLTYNLKHIFRKEMVLSKDVWLPSEADLIVQEVPLGTPSLRAGAMHLGKYCEAKNNEFMLCRSETQDPRLVYLSAMQV